MIDYLSPNTQSAQTVDIFTPLLQYGAVGILAISAIMVAIVLAKRDARTLELERQENTELKKEIKDLNTEIQNILLEIARARNDLNPADLIRKLK